MVSKNDGARQDSSESAGEPVPDLLFPEGSHELDSLRPAEGPFFSDDKLRAMDNFEDVLAAFAAEGIQLLDASDWVGAGSDLIDKERLLGVPFLLIQWKFLQSQDYEGSSFVVCHILTRHNERLMFMDGSKGGIRDDLIEASKNTNQFHAMIVKNGLRKSDYGIAKDGCTMHKNAKECDHGSPREKPGTSWYLNP
jgi:hypothetical protein